MATFLIISVLLLIVTAPTPEEWEEIINNINE